MIVLVNDIVGEFLFRLRSQLVVLVLQHHLPNLKQLGRCIVFKLEDIRETALQSRVRLQHLVHLLSISCQYHHDVWFILGQESKQRLNDTQAIVFRIIGLDEQRICLIYKKNATRSLSQSLKCKRLCITEETSNKFRTFCLYHMATGEHPDAMIYLSKIFGNGGLAGSWITGKYHMHRRHFIIQAMF